MLGLGLSLLGRFSLTLDNQPTAVPHIRSAVGLLIYLACQRERQPREWLEGVFWPDVVTASAKQNLRQNLYLLRRSFPQVSDRHGSAAVPLILADREALQMNPAAAVTVDAHRFSECLAQPTPERLAEAIALYRGDFLTDFYLPGSNPFEEWAAALRAAYRRSVLDALEQLAAHHMAQGEYELAEAGARRQLELDSLRERAHRQLMVALARAGRRTEALAHYQACVALLQRELAVEPAPETSALADRIAAGLEVSPAVSPTMPIVPERVGSSPPVPLFPLLDRDWELLELDRLLAAPETHFITLHGPGGVGKSRLALAVCERQLAARGPATFPHGVYFIDLSRLDTADLLVLTIAAATGCRDCDGAGPRERLLNFLRPRQMLLVLDNFEHVMEGAELVDEILRVAPRVRLLITSRERLNRQAEQVLPLQGLHYPDQDRAPQLDLTGYSALDLFTRSARRSQPDFVLNHDNWADVVRICHLLEGNPLGIILAATWTGTLTPREIAAEIGRDYGFLVTEMSDVPQRQRSLRAVFDHSMRLLTAQERHVFCMLAVFRGGFTREAAQAVTGASLTDLHTLVKKSLLYRGTGRYGIHELLRHFAARELDACGRSDATALAHAAYFTSLAHESAANRYGAAHADTLDRLEAEHANFTAALQWALDHDEIVVAARLAGALGEFLAIRGHLVEGSYWLDKVLSQRHLIPEEDLARALLSAGDIAFERAQYAQAQAAYAESLALWQQLDRPERIAETFNRRGHAAQQEGRYAEARMHYSDSLAWYHRLDDPRGKALALNRMGHVALLQGEFDQARNLCEESLAIRRELDDRRGMAATLNGLAEIARGQGQLERAELLYEECLQLGQELGDQRCIAGVSHNLGCVANAQGRPGEAKALFRAALEIYRELGNREGIGLCLSGVAAGLAADGLMIAAARLLGAAEKLLESVGAQLNPADEHAWQQAVSRVRDELDEAMFAAAWEIGRELPLDRVIALAQAD